MRIEQSFTELSARERAFALLDAGSRNNIQPQSLADALLCGPSLGRVMVERTALYGIKDGELVPLENCDGVRHE